mgnify:CR=1 FL=1
MQLGYRAHLGEFHVGNIVEFVSFSINLTKIYKNITKVNTVTVITR